MSPKKKWLKFDLHMHTTRSDGKNTTEEMLLMAKEKGLDVVAITDHNVANEFSTEEIFKKYGIYAIPGCELSLLSGHLLILGLDPKIISEELKKYKVRATTSSIVVRKKTVRKILRYFIDQGALIIAAHPKIPSGFMSLKGNFLMELYWKGLIHGAETHNGELEQNFKTKLYRLWHKMAKKFISGLNIPPYAGSDAHSKERIGCRFNMVELDDPTKLIEVLKDGKIEIKHGTFSDLN